MTNYEAIKAMTLDEMACFIFGVCDEINRQWIERLKSNGIAFTHYGLAEEMQIEMHKQNLNREIE